MTKMRLRLLKAARNSRLGQRLRNGAGPKLTITERRQRLRDLPAYDVQQTRQAESKVSARLYGSTTKKR